VSNGQLRVTGSGYKGPKGVYGASVAGAPSDKVWGMDLPCSHHVNFRFTWQWTVASGP
jgi:hypothetical protein